MGLKLKNILKKSLPVAGGGLLGGPLGGAAGLVLGGGAKKLLGGGKSDQPQTTTTTNSPWGPQQPYIEDLYQKAKANYATNTPAYYPGQTLAGQSANTLAALKAQGDRARAGSLLAPASNAELNKTISGGYLSADSNPYLKGYVNQALGDARTLVGSQFGGGSNYGSSANQEWLQRKGIEASAPIYAQNYENERGRQMQALGYVPQMAQMDYNDIDRLANVGQQEEARAQSVIEADRERFEAERDAPNQRLAQYANIIYGMNPGGTQVSKAPAPYRNRGAGILGGALGGAQLAGPWGALGGALLGGGLLG